MDRVNGWNSRGGGTENFYSLAAVKAERSINLEMSEDGGENKCNLRFLEMQVFQFISNSCSPVGRRRRRCLYPGFASGGH